MTGLEVVMTISRTVKVELEGLFFMLKGFPGTNDGDNFDNCSIQIFYEDSPNNPILEISPDNNVKGSYIAIGNGKKIYIETIEDLKNTIINWSLT